jgi:hypothetical protein
MCERMKKDKIDIAANIVKKKETFNEIVLEFKYEYDMAAFKEYWAIINW